MLGSRAEPISRHTCKVEWCETSFGFSTKVKVDPESWGRSPAYGEVVWEWSTWLELKRGVRFVEFAGLQEVVGVCGEGEAVREC